MGGGIGEAGDAIGEAIGGDYTRKSKWERLPSKGGTDGRMRYRRGEMYCVGVCKYLSLVELQGFRAIRN